VTELVTAADACKASVSEYAQSQNAYPANTDAAGCSNNATKYVASLDVTNGVITLVARGINSAVDTKKFVLKPTNAAADLDKPLEWTCDTAAGTDIPSKYRPANCR
jgi:type IV pilus assembly protein PilA